MRQEVTVSYMSSPPVAGKFTQQIMSAEMLQDFMKVEEV